MLSRLSAACISRMVERRSSSWQFCCVSVMNTALHFGSTAAKAFNPAIRRARRARVRRHSQNGQSLRLQTRAPRNSGSPRSSPTRGISSAIRQAQLAIARPMSRVSASVIRARVIGRLYRRCLVNFSSGSTMGPGMRSTGPAVGAAGMCSRWWVHLIVVPPFLRRNWPECQLWRAVSGAQTPESCLRVIKERRRAPCQGATAGRHWRAKPVQIWREGQAQGAAGRQGTPYGSRGSRRACEARRSPR